MVRLVLVLALALGVVNFNVAAQKCPGKYVINQIKRRSQCMVRKAQYPGGKSRMQLKMESG